MRNALLAACAALCATAWAIAPASAEQGRAGRHGDGGGQHERSYQGQRNNDGQRQSYQRQRSDDGARQSFQGQRGGGGYDGPPRQAYQRQRNDEGARQAYQGPRGYDGPPRQSYQGQQPQAYQGQRNDAPSRIYQSRQRQADQGQAYQGQRGYDGGRQAYQGQRNYRPEQQRGRNDLMGAPNNRGFDARDNGARMYGDRNQRNWNDDRSRQGGRDYASRNGWDRNADRDRGDRGPRDFNYRSYRDDPGRWADARRRYGGYHQDWNHPRYADWRNVPRGRYFDYGYASVLRSYYGRPYYWWSYDGWRRPYRPWSVGYVLPSWIYWDELPYDLYYQLPPAPYGCRYIYVDGDVLLVAIASGLILDALLLASY